MTTPPSHRASPSPAPPPAPPGRRAGKAATPPVKPPARAVPAGGAPPPEEQPARVAERAAGQTAGRPADKTAEQAAGGAGNAESAGSAGSAAGPLPTPPEKAPGEAAPAPMNVVEKAAEKARPLLRILGPRGIQGFFGWTFFDPANLVSVALLLGSATLVVVSMRAREAPDWGMALGLYACIFLFLRGYFFNYYHGRAFGRITVVLVLLLALVASAALWEDAAPAHRALRAEGVREVPRAEGFHIAALLHLVVTVTLFIHVCLPRRWIIRATDELADRGGRDTAADAPIETIDDPVERARRQAKIEKPK